MKRRANGEGTIYELTDNPNRKKRFRAERFVTLPDGTQRRIAALGETRPKAWAALDAKVKKAKDANPDAARLRVETHMAEWMEGKRLEIRPTTAVSYDAELRNHIIPGLGRLYMQQVTPTHIQRLLRGLQQRGQFATASRVHVILKQAFRQAARMGLIARNPLDQLDPLKQPTPKRGMWTPEQIQLFLDSTGGHHYYPLFLTAILTGLRAGELTALRWGDLTDSHIRVQRTATPKGEALPKSRAGLRVVPLPPDLRIALGRRGRAEDPVFRGTTGAAVSAPELSKILRRTTRSLGLPDIRFHDLRRVYATLLARKGAHPRTIQELMGHSTPYLAMAVYTEVMQDQIERATLGLADISGGSRGSD